MVNLSNQPSKDKSQSYPNPAETSYQKLLQTFEVLAGITDPVRFEVEFEKEQRRSGLRLTTFRQAYRAWIAQRERGVSNDFIS